MHACKGTMSVVKGTGVYRIACSVSESPWTCRFYVIFFVATLALQFSQLHPAACGGGARALPLYTCIFINRVVVCLILTKRNYAVIMVIKNSDLLNFRGFVTGMGGRPKPRLT